MSVTSPSRTSSPPPSVSVSSLPARTVRTPVGSGAPRRGARAIAAGSSESGSERPTVTLTSRLAHRRGRRESRGCRIGATTRPVVETRKASAPRRRTSTARSGAITTRSVFGKARSYSNERTPGNGSTRRASEVPSTLSRLCPTSSFKAARTCAWSAGVPPRISSVCTAKIDVSRATAYAPSASTSSATPIASERPDGATPLSEGAPRRTASVAARVFDRFRAATRQSSPRSCRPLQRGQLERPEELHLVLELDPEPLVHAPPRLGHQRDAVGARRPVGVLDEVRVARGDDRAADPVALEPHLFDQAAGAALTRRVLEDAAEGALVRRLGCLALREQLGGDRLHCLGRARLESEAHACDDLAALQAGMAGGEGELLDVERAWAAGVDDDCVGHHVLPLPPLPARGPAHPPAPRP